MIIYLLISVLRIRYRLFLLKEGILGINVFIFALLFVAYGVWRSPVSALRSGRRGRWFESTHPDEASDDRMV